jgi:aspartyl-tRNA(Asn)/glutamyl-tRNA(Gln) amidotransferase subunit A
VTDPIDRIEFEGRVLHQDGFAALCRRLLPQWRDRMDPALVAWIERGSRFSLIEYREAEFACARLFHGIQALFKRYDFLVTPTNSRAAPPTAFDAANDEAEIGGVKCGIARQGWTSYQYPFNLTGRPAISVPSGFGDDGSPTGRQIIGRWGGDNDVFRFASFLEQARPWAQRRPAPSPFCRAIMQAS